VILSVRCYACLLINVVIWYCWCRRTNQTDELNIESVTGMLCFCCLMMCRVCIMYLMLLHAVMHITNTHTQLHTLF